MKRTPARGLGSRVALALGVLLFAGCASDSAPTATPRPAPVEGPAASGLMDQVRLERLFEARVEKVTGYPGAMRSQIDGFLIVVLSDPTANRMRIVVPVASTDQLDERYFKAMLESNYHSALDARYAMSEGVVYAMFLHPLSSLSEGLFDSGFDQTLHLAKTFGTTFSSGVLEFGVPDGR